MFAVGSVGGEDGKEDLILSGKKKTYDSVPAYLGKSVDAEDRDALVRSGSVREKRKSFQQAAEEKAALDQAAKSPEKPTLARINTRKL